MSETIEAKSYVLRELQSKDVFPMFRIISKIGVNEFKECFQTDEIMKLASAASNEEAVKTVGIKVVADVVTVVLSHIGDAEQDIYLFLSQISGMSKEEISELPFTTFTSMVVDVFQKEEFKDFISVVSKLFK